MLATFSSANIRTACTDETGSGSLVFSNGPTLSSALFLSNPIYNLQPMCLSKFTQYSSISYSSSAAANTAFNANSVGNLTYDANTTAAGMVIKTRVWFQINSWTGGGTLSFLFYLDGSSFLSVAAPGTGPYASIEFEATVRPLSLFRVHGALLVSGQSPVVSEATGSWDTTIAHTIDVRMLWIKSNQFLDWKHSNSLSGIVIFVFSVKKNMRRTII